MIRLVELPKFTPRVLQLPFDRFDVFGRGQALWGFAADPNHRLPNRMAYIVRCLLQAQLP